MFKVGEIVVYPRQGAGKVVARERKHILGEDHEYLTIRIFQSELTMLVRCDGVEAAASAGRREAGAAGDHQGARR